MVCLMSVVSCLRAGYDLVDESSLLDWMIEDNKRRASLNAWLERSFV